MEALNLIPRIVLMLGMAGIIAGAVAISLGSFGNTLDSCEDTSLTYNTTGKYCTNSSTAGVGGIKGDATGAYLATINSQEGIKQISTQFGTIGVIGVMVIIISLIASVFVYFKYF